MRIVLLNDSSVARGGATALALLQARLLRGRGIDVTFIAGDEGAAPELEELGVRVIGLGGKLLLDAGKLSAFVRGIHNSETRAHIAQWIAEHDTADTIYHLHGWSRILSPSVFQALAPVAKRTVVHAHDFFLACPNGVFMDYPHDKLCDRRPLSAACLSTHCDKRSYPQKLWRSARQVAVKRSFAQDLPWAGIALIHPGMRDHMKLAGYADARMISVRNPVVPFSDTRIAAEKNQGLAFVGRLEEGKGLQKLIAAAETAQVPLTVIGEGVLREHLQQAHPQVTFTGWKSREEIAGLLLNARALVMPSQFREPFGLVAVEASRSGLPVVVSDTAYLAPEFAQARLGWACNTRDAADFAATLAAVRDTAPDVLHDMSERGFARQVPLANTPDGWIDALLTLYRRALG